MKKKISKKNLLVIGGTGFIGFHILKKAQKLKWKLTSISRNRPQKKRFVKGVNYLKINIVNNDDLRRKIVGDYDYIINLMGVSAGAFSRIKDNKIYKDQFKGSKNIIDFFSKKKIERFIQIGSSAEYGAIRIPHHEKKNCKPISSYGKSKLKITKYLVKKYKKKNMPFTIVRLFQVYGEKQNMNKIVPFIINNCLYEKSFNLTEGKQIRDFCHIDDVVKAIFVLLKIKRNNINGEIFNVGLGKSISIKNLTKLIKQKIGKGKPIFNVIPIKKNEIMKSQASIIKMKKIVGWSPKISLSKGVDSLIKKNG